MTISTVHRSARGLEGFSLKGHAGYAEEGLDIVCSAASILIITCANALESVVNIKPKTHVDEAECIVLLPKSLTPEQLAQSQIVLATILQGFQDLACSYSTYFNIENNNQ